MEAEGKHGERNKRVTALLDERIVRSYQSLQFKLFVTFYCVASALKEKQTRFRKINFIFLAPLIIMPKKLQKSR